MNTREIPFVNDRQACERIIGKAINKNLFVSEGDITPPVTVNATLPIKGIGRGDTVNLFGRKNAAFDRTAFNKIVRFCTKSMPKNSTLQERINEMPTNQLAALIAVTQVGSYNCNEKAKEVEMYVGKKCRLSIGTATKTSKNGENESFFATCVSILGLPSDQLDIVTIDGFYPVVEAVTTVNWGGASTNQFADWGLGDEEEEEEEDVEEDDTVYSVAEASMLTRPQIEKLLGTAAKFTRSGAPTAATLNAIVGKAKLV